MVMRILVKGGNPAGVIAAVLLKRHGYNVLLCCEGRRLYGVNPLDIIPNTYLNLLQVEADRLSEGIVKKIRIAENTIKLSQVLHICRIGEVLEKAAAQNELNIHIGRDKTPGLGCFDAQIECRYLRHGDLPVYSSLYVSEKLGEIEEENISMLFENKSLAIKIHKRDNLIVSHVVGDNENYVNCFKLISGNRYWISFNSQEPSACGGAAGCIFSPFGATTAEMFSAILYTEKLSKGSEDTKGDEIFKETNNLIKTITEGASYDAKSLRRLISLWTSIL